MKISNAIFMFGLTAARSGIMGGKMAETINRRIQGDWVNRMSPRHRRDDIDGAKGFQPLAAMILYMTGFDGDNKNPETHNNFNAKMGELEDIYTSYGCYCWIDGVESGVIGGGRPIDMSDHHCKELYRCYKCANIDYATNYTDVDYSVDFTTDNNNARNLDCKVNSKQTGENICECDKRFAQNIAATQQSCKANAADNSEYGAYCLDEQYRTESGKVLGKQTDGVFKPRSECKKRHMNHNKDECCGIYPNRYPYDSNFKECCQEEITTGGNGGTTSAFTLFTKDHCVADGGVVVKSVEGSPHSYVAVGAN